MRKPLNQQVDIILLDFAKAFDKVQHERLIHKLDYYRVGGTTLKWIRPFLSHRQQEVVLDGVTSDTAQVTSGVPQGTVLGPLLFLVFINDLPESIKSAQCKLFADDSLLYKVIENQADSNILQLDLTTLDTWEEMWQMSFNHSKCIVLRIAPRNKKKLQYEYKLHGHILETEEGSSYLWVTITDNLMWDKHIQNITNKGNRTLGLIQRNLRECTGYLYSHGTTITGVCINSLGYTEPGPHQTA